MELEIVFNSLKEVPFSSLPDLQEIPLATLFPKKSKSLARNMLKDIGSTNEPRLLVIIGHLYFDFILQKMLDRELHSLTKRQQESFHTKLDYLNSLGKFNCQTYACLVAVNRLRNSFAHNIFFEIVSWDPQTIPFVHQYELRIPKQKKFLRAFNIILIRLSFLAVLDELVHQNRWLYLENVPKN